MLLKQYYRHSYIYVGIMSNQYNRLTIIAYLGNHIWIGIKLQQIESALRVPIFSRQV